MHVHLSVGAIPFSVIFRAHCLCNAASVAFLLFSDSFSAFSILSCAKRPSYQEVREDRHTRGAVELVPLWSTNLPDCLLSVIIFVGPYQ